MSYQYGFLRNYGWNNRGVDRRFFLIPLKQTQSKKPSFSATGYE